MCALHHIYVIFHAFVPVSPYFQSTPCQPSQKHEASFAADGLIIAETLLLVWPLYAGSMDDFLFCLPKERERERIDYHLPFLYTYVLSMNSVEKKIKY